MSCSHCTRTPHAHDCPIGKRTGAPREAPPVCRPYVGAVLQFDDYAAVVIAQTKAGWLLRVLRETKSGAPGSEDFEVEIALADHGKTWRWARSP